jgi:parvulin-like peptidyl-prolyl isomerase
MKLAIHGMVTTRWSVGPRRVQSVVYILAVALAALLSACAAKTIGPEEAPLAYVNGEAITARDIEEGFESSHRGHGVLLAGKGAVREFLDKSIDRLLLVQEARRIGLEQDPEIREAVRALVAERARKQLYEDEVAKHIQVSDAAITDAYGKMDQRYRVSQILLYTRDDAERALARLRAGEPFGALASEMSVSVTASKGGDLGFVSWGQLDPRLEREIEMMQPGELRGPLLTDQGWNILLLQEKRPWPERPDLDKVRNRIKMTLGQRAMSQRSTEFYHELRSRWNAQVFEGQLTAENLLEWPQRGPNEAQAKQVIVAAAGDRTITLADLRARLNLHALQKYPQPYALEQVRRVLDNDVFALLLEREALRREYGNRPEIASEARKLENGLLMDRLGTIVFARITVTEEDVRRFYDQNLTVFTEPEAVRLAIIALEISEDAETVLQELRGGADFAAVARQRSKDPGTAQRGGELGWVTRGKLDPAIEAAAFSLERGQLGVAKSSKAAFVLLVEDRRPPRLQGFSRVKEQAREMATKQRQREEVTRWIGRLRSASEIVIDDQAIEKAVAKFEAEA